MLIHVLCCSTIYISECTRFWDLTITGQLVSQRSLGRADINKGPPTYWCRELGHAHCRVFSCLQQTVGHDTLFCVGIDDVAHLSSPLKFFQTLSSSCTVSDDVDIRDSPPISVWWVNYVDYILPCRRLKLSNIISLGLKTSQTLGHGDRNERSIREKSSSTL